MPFQCSIDFLVLVRESCIALCIGETAIAAVTGRNEFPLLICVNAREVERGRAKDVVLGLTAAPVWRQIIYLDQKHSQDEKESNYRNTTTG